MDRFDAQGHRHQETLNCGVFVAHPTSFSMKTQVWYKLTCREVM